MITEGVLDEPSQPVQRLINGGPFLRFFNEVRTAGTRCADLFQDISPWQKK